MKKKISREIYDVEIIMLLTGLVFIYRLRFISKEGPAIEDILLSVSGILLIWFSVILIRNRLIIECDDNYLYLTRGKNSIVLPLSNVTTIEATVSGSRWRREFILKYLDADAKTFTIHFTPNEDGSLEEFGKLVKKQNPQVNYQPYSKFF
ncbi:MAG: hypothetical protein QM802_03755 [Agriterribacter sp.]